MAKIQFIFICAFVLALITCHEILSTEGRPIKSTNKQDSVREMGKQGSHNINLHDNKAELKEDTQAANPDHVPNFDHSVARTEEIIPPISPTDSLADKDDFRPTTPGNSPGGGHKSFEGSSKDVQPKAPAYGPGVGHFGSEFKGDFGPKYPAQSPGVGHSVAGKTDDYRTTNPGHSPGAGHSDSLQTRDAEPNA